MLKNSLLFFRGIPLKPNVFTVKFASMLKAVKMVHKNINNKKFKKKKPKIELKKIEMQLSA